jgi:hypothetical protein
LPGATQADLNTCLAGLLERARAGMYAEGFDVADCSLVHTLQISTATGEGTVPLLNGALPADLPVAARLSVKLVVAKHLPEPPLRGRLDSGRAAAKSQTTRSVRGAREVSELPVFRVEDQTTGVSAVGPAVLEEAYFTCRLDAGWRFEINDAGDILLSRA